METEKPPHWIAFDPQDQSAHLEQCSCADASQYTFFVGSSHDLSEDEIVSTVEDNGGPSAFTLSPCILSTRSSEQ